MKKIKEKTLIPSYVEQSTTMFQTDDGEKFKTEEEALKHEEHLKKNSFLYEKYKIKDIDTEEYGIDYYDSLSSARLVYIEEKNDINKEELQWLYRALDFNKLKKGWNFFIETEYDSCSYGGGYDLHVEHLEYVILEKELQLKKMKELL